VGPLDWRAAVEAAARRIAPYARRTPLLRSEWLSGATGAEVWLKLENLQYSGSFKLRGALGKALALGPADRERPVVTASTGNHGAAVAWALRAVGLTGTVYVPEAADPGKVRRIRALGARIEVHGRDSGETEAHARAVAGREGAVYISPYNDPEVVAGQGTAALEVVEDLGPPDAVIVAVGGGGLVAGMAGYLDAVAPATAVVGCSPRHSAVMAESVRQGRIVEMESLPTLSDGTAGGVEPDAITFPWCRDLVDHWELVEEDAIAAAMRATLEREHLLIEGSAGVAVATALRLAGRWQGGRVVVLVCGGNVGLETLRTVLAGG
jgi:threonine dehydratase